ncbi:hypothetical protein L6452_30921 [Arctium lappa]|uniref:Uncharacterized protein n=1 Tax=Arctium lappa TaxID=4217 RepID=A0ACB8ZKH6_ARCLA|nr:hypothetical protein L6452_30921 [Arctium lappa]
MPYRDVRNMCNSGDTTNVVAQPCVHASSGYRPALAIGQLKNENTMDVSAYRSRKSRTILTSLLYCLVPNFLLRFCHCWSHPSSIAIVIL